MGDPRIDTTYWREKSGVGRVVVIHDIVLQDLRLSWCSNVLDERCNIISVVIGPAVITSSICWRELMTH